MKNRNGNGNGVDGSDDTRHLAAPDFCTYMVLHCEALAAMARRLGRGQDAAAHDGEAAALRRAVNQHLWEEADGLYFDRDVRSGAFRAFDSRRDRITPDTVLASAAKALSGRGLRRVVNGTGVVLHTNLGRSVLSEAAMRRIVDRCQQTGTWLLSDEVYRGAEIDGVETASMWGRSPRAIITSGLSK